MVGQEHIMQTQIVQMISHHPHHLVSLHIMHVQDVQIVKTIIKRLRNLKLQIHYTIEHSNLLKLDHPHEVVQFASPRVDSLQFFNQHGTCWNPQKVLEIPLQRNHVAILKSSNHSFFKILENFIFILQVDTLLKQTRSIFKSIKQKLQSLASRRVLSFVLEYLRQNVFSIIQKTKIFISLDQHSIIGDYFQPLQQVTSLPYVNFTENPISKKSQGMSDPSNL